LADDSLFIEKINQRFEAADAELLGRVHAFCKVKKSADDSIGYEAAGLLFKQRADAIALAASLLAPLVWRNTASIGDIRERFGHDTAAALEGLHSAFFPHGDTAPRRRKDIQSLLIAIGGVTRKALLFITFRLLALERAASSPSSSAGNMARETLDLLVPIADRLSLGDLRRRLEDACFRILDPKGYAYLKENAAPIQAEDDECLQILLGGVRRLLENNGIACRLQGRTKSLHGIHRKMARTGRSLDEIMDRVGLRVIVASIPECYEVLSLLHAHFKPIPGTFDDFIWLPKDNGYQSLHTCVYPVREIYHKPIEFQVRTALMHMEAEYGAAAHWRYKSDAEAADRDRRSVQWMQGLAHQRGEAAGGEELVELLNRRVFQDHPAAIGDGGRIVRPAKEATVRDCPTITSSEVPHGAVVRVNGRNALLDHPLLDGDSILVPACDSAAGQGEREAAGLDARSGVGAPYPFVLDLNDAEPPAAAVFRSESRGNRYV